MTMRRRVVVTGLGALTPLGLNVSSTWKALVAGTSGVGPITRFDASDFPVRIAAQVPSFSMDPWLEPKEQRVLDVFVHYALVAASEALSDAGLTLEAYPERERIGVALGSGIGGMPLMQKNYDQFSKGGVRRVSPFYVPSTIINMAAGLVAMKYQCLGPNIALVSACTTGAHNILYAARTIAYGDADIMLAGASEMAICEMGVAGFSAMRALSTRHEDPARASRPWDVSRDGFVLGDGAGVLILEDLDHALRRGARIYAEFLGGGMSADAYHMTQPAPDGSGGARAMRAALADASLRPEQVDYLNAHATSTPLGDETEVAAIKQVFAEHAYRLPVSSTKSMTGHLLGAAGAVEAIFSILSLRDGIIPPTLHLENPSPGCDLDFVPGVARKANVRTVMSNSFGFGGTNASLVFGAHA